LLHGKATRESGTELLAVGMSRNDSQGVRITAPPTRRNVPQLTLFP